MRGLVKRIAYHLAGRLPSSVEVEDLIQAGMIGLLEAAAHFASDRGASFETYAGIRIRGAMIDALRQLDWAPRSVHRKAREVAEAMRTIETRQGRPASDTEVAASMGIPLQEYHEIVQGVPRIEPRRSGRRHRHRGASSPIRCLRPRTARCARPWPIPSPRCPSASGW